ncbi:MAG: glycoside hydrolase [Alicyclobacillus sp.]|nr:glycoside hydrolase [Alicyclobacillus sp.]
MSTIYQPTYDNTIKPQPSGSAYAWAADTGVLQAQFADTIGTDNAIQIVTQGYQFAWRPDTVNVIDTDGNITLLDQVNAGATAQVWRNKITYVGTTAATSDEFVVDGNQLKHSVRMVAPPRLPDGYTGTPQWLAIGGDIGTTAQDWQDIELWADGTTHLSDFTTGDDLSFRLKSSGKEVYRIPHITITDDAGNVQSGQYKLAFGTDDTVTLYMLCPWDWMQKAEYPVIIDPTVIVSAAYDTSVNGGRKIVRLSNGWIVAGALNGSGAANQILFYVSQDNGQTWRNLCYYEFGGSSAYATSAWAIASAGTTVYLLTLAVNVNVAAYIEASLFDATTVSGNVSSGNYISSENGDFGGVSLAIDGQGYLHAVWKADNNASPNVSNLRYAKGTISGSTVTWSTPTQITTQTTSGIDYPCLFIANGNPCIVFRYGKGSIGFATWNGTSWVVNNQAIYSSSDSQSDPCAAVDNNGNIHVVWEGMNSSSGGNWCLYYSVSSDGGSTWASPTVVLQGSSSPSASYGNPTITISPTGDLYVFLEAETTQYSGVMNIGLVKRTGSSWGSLVYVTTNTNSAAQSPQSLWSAYNMNSTDAARVIYEDMQAGAVEYYSIPLDSPPNSPILAPSANFDATLAQTLSWQFSDPDPGDSQSAYQLQILDTSTSTTVVDTGKVASTSSIYSLAANTLTNGKQYPWRVTTWDSSGEQGPWSSYSTFNCAATPSVTLTTPASAATVSTSSLTAQWSYSDPASNPQQSFQLQLLQSDDATVLWDSGTVNGTGNQMTVQYTLSNNTTYHLRVRATNSQGITSAWADNSFSTSFTPPAQAGVTLTADSANARISVTINNPAPSSGQPAVAYNDLYRRNSGASTWTRIATQLPAGATYHDYATASGQAYDYKVTTVGNNGTQSESVVSSASITFSGVWLHDPLDPSGTAHRFRLPEQNRTAQAQYVQTMMQFEGRTLPVADVADQQTRQVQVTIDCLNSNGDLQALRTLIGIQNTLCYRDARGRKLFGVVAAIPETDQWWGTQVQLTVQAVDYSEDV